jgi:hypothetical protein
MNRSLIVTSLLVLANTSPRADAHGIEERHGINPEARLRIGNRITGCPRNPETRELVGVVARKVNGAEVHARRDTVGAVSTLAARRQAGRQAVASTDP